MLYLIILNFKGKIMSIIEKKVVKNKAVSTKITELQNQKLETLAKKKGITKSNLISQLLSLGFEQVAKKKL
jgi:hypothetical protein